MVLSPNDMLNHGIDESYKLYVPETGNPIFAHIEEIICRHKQSMEHFMLYRYLIVLILLFKLVMKVDLIPPSFKALNLSRFFRCGVLLLARVIAVTFCPTLASSLAIHQGATSMAGFQICLQIWLSSSLLVDGLAVVAQAILATAFAQGDYRKITLTSARVLQDQYWRCWREYQKQRKMKSTF